MKPIDSRLFAALCASDAACNLMEIMPDCDLIDELKTLMHIQYDIICHIVDEREYDGENIMAFIEYTEEIANQVIRIQEQQ